MKNYKKYFCLILCIIVFIFAFVLYLSITDHGVGVNSDSVTYFNLANKVINGEGYLSDKNNSTHFPPGYPLLLALSGSFKSNIAESARWLHAFLYASNAVLLGISVYFCTRCNLVAMSISFLFFFSSRILLTIHSYAWSESPFIFLTLLSYLLLSYYISKHRWVYLILSSILLGLAITTRYIGVALIPPVILVLLLLDNQAIKIKIKAIFINLGLSMLPIGMWVIRNFIFTHSAVNRVFIYHPKGLYRIGSDIIEVFHDFFLPDADSTIFKTLEILLLFILIIVAIIILQKKRNIFTESDLVAFSSMWLGLFFCVSFIIIVTFSMFFFDAATSFNERILSPVLVMLTVSIIPLAFNTAFAVKKQVIWIIFVAYALFLVRIDFFPVVETARDLHRNGIGYNAEIWDDSPTLSMLQGIHPEIKIYSNGNDIIPYKTGIDASRIPVYYSSMDLTQNGNFNHQIKAMCQEIKEGKALFVYLDAVTWRDYLPSEAIILDKCDLPVLYDTEDGTIFGVLK